MGSLPAVLTWMLRKRLTVRIGPQNSFRRWIFKPVTRLGYNPAGDTERRPSYANYSIRQGNVQASIKR